MLSERNFILSRAKYNSISSSLRLFRQTSTAYRKEKKSKEHGDTAMS